jgi:hypothetical protein
MESYPWTAVSEGCEVNPCARILPRGFSFRLRESREAHCSRRPNLGIHSASLRMAAKGLMLRNNANGSI